MSKMNTSKFNNQMSIWNIFLQRSKIIYLQQGGLSNFDSIFWNFQNILENFDTVLLKKTKKQEINRLNTFNWFYSFNSKFQKIYENSFLILVDTNPRFEASTLNIMIGNQVSNWNSKIFHLGHYYDLYYKNFHFGIGTSSLLNIIEGRSILAKILRSKDKGSLIIGSNVFAKTFGNFYTHLYNKLLEKSYCNQHFINSNVSDLMILNNQKNLELSRKFFDCFKSNTGIYIFSENSSTPSFEGFSFKGLSIINQNSHLVNIPLKKNQQLYNIPTKPVFEKSSLLINLENKIQFAPKVVSLFNSNLISSSQFFFSYLLSTFEFFRMHKQLTNSRIFVNKKLKKFNKPNLDLIWLSKNNFDRVFQKAIKQNNEEDYFTFENKFKFRKRLNLHLKSFNKFWKFFDLYNYYYYFQNSEINKFSFFSIESNFNFSKKVKIKNTLFSSNIKNFYLTDLISQNSPTMLNCSFFTQSKINFKNIID